MTSARLLLGLGALYTSILMLMAFLFDRDMPKDMRIMAPYSAAIAAWFAWACLRGAHYEALCYLLMLGGMGWGVVYCVWTFTEDW